MLVKEKSRPSAAALSPQAIIGLAIEQADTRGIEQVSMRKLAAELGVTPMALYWHFANRDALLDAMAEHVAGEVVYEDDPGAAWQERLRAVLTAAFSLFQQHPWLGPLARERIVAAPNFLRALEALLDAVRTAGYGPKDSVRVVDLAIGSLAAMAGDPVGAKAEPVSEEQLEMRRQLLDLAKAEYPRIREAAVPLTTFESTDAYRKLGIEILVGGIESAAPKKRGGDR